MFSSLLLLPHKYDAKLRGALLRRPSLSPVADPSFHFKRFSPEEVEVAASMTCGFRRYLYCLLLS